MAFPKVGYHGIKVIFEKKVIEYMKPTIIQASQLKSKLEKLHIKKVDATFVSFDDVKMCFLIIKCKLVEKAVMYFAQHHPVILLKVTYSL